MHKMDKMEKTFVKKIISVVKYTVKVWRTVLEGFAQRALKKIIWNVNPIQRYEPSQV